MKRIKLSSILQEASNTTLESELRKVIAKELESFITGNEQKILASKIQAAVVQLLIKEKLLPF